MANYKQYSTIEYVAPQYDTIMGTLILKGGRELPRDVFPLCTFSYLYPPPFYCSLFLQKKIGLSP